MATFKAFDSFEYLGIRVEVGIDDPFPGVRWKIHWPTGPETSPGAFYVGTDGYSVGCVIGSAGEKARRMIDKSLNIA